MWTGHKCQYGERAFHVGNISLQTLTQNMYGNFACLCHYEVHYGKRFYLAVDTVIIAE